MASRMILRNLERQPVRSLVSVLGIAFAVAVLFVGLAFIDVMNVLINEQFDLAMRQDATVAFVEPRSTARDLRNSTPARRHGRRAAAQQRRSACGTGRGRGRSRSPDCRPRHG